MSNTQMVSAPRTLDEVLAELPESYSRDDVAYGWHECLDNIPAVQHQGEPVALPAAMHPHDFDNLPEAHCNGWNACLDEIAKLGPLFSHPVQGEPVAWLREDGDGGLELTASGDGIGFAVYTHADSAEVERLRAVIEQQKNLIESLRAELVESYSIDASAESSAPVEIDERAEFERRYPDYDHTLCSHEDWKDQYNDPKLGDMWNGWRARAALERKP